ncbi:MAG: SDR family oxidoreductase [Clostridia bacterium]|nr:SDR family oxidoreductase [Clostridia bacterium]
MLEVKNRWILVTGASRGLGRLIASELANKGCNLILQSRNKSNTSDIEEKVRENGGKAVSMTCDLGIKEDLLYFIEELDKYDIDIVYNNAGIQVTYRPNVFDTTYEDYELSFRVNTIAPMMICYSLAPKMIAKGFGRIVNTTSGIDNEPEQGPYSASKAGLDKVTADLNKLFEGKDIKAFLTDPGWCRTDLGGPMAPNDPASAVNGLLAPGLVSVVDKVNFKSVIHAQDYKDMDLKAVVEGLEDGRFPF